MTSFQIFAGRLVSCKLIDIYLFMMRQGARARYREREGGQGNKQVYPPPLLLKGGKSRELSKGGGSIRTPLVSVKNLLSIIVVVSLIFLVSSHSSNGSSPWQIAWSFVFAFDLSYTWLFFRQRFESFANDSVTFRLRM